MCASHCLAVKPRDAVPVETHKLTFAHHRVSSGSVVRASDLITEGRRFKSHLGLKLHLATIQLDLWPSRATEQ